MVAVKNYSRSLVGIDKGGKRVDHSFYEGEQVDTTVYGQPKLRRR